MSTSASRSHRARPPADLAVALVLAASLGCAPGQTGGARNAALSTRTAHGGEINEAELQDRVQRYTGQFLDRTVQAMDPLIRSSDRDVSDAALKSALLYASSSLDIATGPLPEVDVLDMVVFMRLCRDAFESHWLPIYGDAGRPVLAAFEASDRDARELAGAILGAEDLARLDAMVERWRRENPDQYRVEEVRLLDFSQRAGTVEEERAKEAGGLLSDVKRATQAADQAVILGERSMFLATRMPFLLRLQARLGTREIVSDAFASAGPPGRMMAQAQNFEPVLMELPQLLQQSERAAREARLFVDALHGVLPSPEAVNQLRSTLASANDLTTRTITLVEALRGLSAPTAESADRRVIRGLDAFAKRALVGLALLGAALSALWWGGYYIARRALR